MKKITAILLSIMFLLTVLPVYSASGTRYFYDGKWHDYKAAPISLTVNGKALQFDVPPILLNDSTLVPVRAVFEELGAKVGWDQSKMQATITMGITSITLSIDDVNAVVNGITYKMPIPPKIVNDRTMIPARFVAEYLGMKVEWVNAGRIVKIDSQTTSNDININNIQSSVNGSKIRVTISADAPINDYSSVEINDYPRLAVDIKNSLLTSPNTQVDVSGNYIYKVRAAQNSKSPDITRIVADLKDWADYNITLSDDKKQLYIDFNNGPAEISNITFSSSGGAEMIDLAVKGSVRPVISSSDSNGKITIDIPSVSVGNLSKSISAGGNTVKTIECSQYDSNTARLTVNISGTSLLEFVNRDGGLRLMFSSPESRGISYNKNDYPQLVFKNEKIGFNYFNYRFRNDGNKYVVSIPSHIFGLGTGRLFINDNYVDYIDISKSSDYGFTDFTFNGTKAYDYKVDSIDNSEEIIVSMLPGSDSSDRGTDRSVSRKIKDKLVVIDPGHGGAELGAIYPTDASGSDIQVKEKDLNLDISLKLYNLLKNAGIKVMMTRQDDTNPGLYDRGDLANSNDASLFISVHNNSGNSSDNGTMTLYYPSFYDDKYGISGEKYAQIAQEEMTKSLGTSNLGVWKRPRLAVLNAARMPSILAEVAYVSNDYDRQNLLTESFKQKAAEALYNATIRALNLMADNTETSSTAADTVEKWPGTQSGSMNGFSVPSNSYSKCDYKGNSMDSPSNFDLSIKLDYSKEKSKTATLEEQRNEAKQVLLSKLDENTVNDIMNEISGLQDISSSFYNDELGNSSYTVWVRCLRNTGVATIDIMHK